MIKPIKKRKQTVCHKVLGFVLFSVGLVFLIWNEFKIVGFNELCSSALRKIKSVDIYKLDSSYEGELVYLSGAIVTNETLSQPDYGVSVPAVRLKRRVQMYQWIEVAAHMSEEPAGAQVLYQTDWRDKLIDSSSFVDPVTHQNPKSFPLKSEISVNNFVYLGIYYLSEDFKVKFDHFTLVTSDQRPERRDIKMHAGLYYHTADVWNPAVGDTRLQFSYAGLYGDVISIIGTQRGSSVSGEDLLLMEHGRVSAEDMVYNEHNKYIWTHHLLRLASWLLIYISTYYSSFITLLKTRYHKSTNFFTMDGWLSVNFSVSSLLAVAAVSLVWIHVSPWMSTSVWIVALCPLIISSYLREAPRYPSDYMQLQ